MSNSETDHICVQLRYAPDETFKWQWRLTNAKGTYLRPYVGSRYVRCDGYASFRFTATRQAARAARKYSKLRAKMDAAEDVLLPTKFQL